jgi:hypothetical protein
MFNFFNKSPKTETKVSTSNYPAIVDEIHNEFFTAGDNILDEAKSLLTQLETQDIAKGKRLAALGFGKTREAVAAIETENKLATTKEIAELVVHYKVNYPNNKFITEEQVKAICEKYGLVCGETSAYKGFVPESKLLEIERFKFKKEDAPFAYIEDGDGVVKKILEKDDFKNTECNFFKERMGIEGNGFFSSNSNGAKFIGYNTTTLYGTSSRIMPFNVKLKICAPLKDMEVKSNQQVKGYKIMDIPDPVVLQPVRGGYLCVCAWGDESSDEIVVNQQMN